MGTLQKAFVMGSGERYCLLVDASGLPLYYPNLYITTQVRNRSLSLAAMESALSGISVLYRYLGDRGENLQARFHEGNYLGEFELDAIRDCCQIKYLRTPRKGFQEGAYLLEEMQWSKDKVSSETEYGRLTAIATYLKWLAEQVSGVSKDRLSVLDIGKMEKSLKSRRPVKKGRNAEGDVQGLSKEQIKGLFELFRPESDLNPFRDISIRVRNRLMFLMLYHLGVRGGELLNIRIRDIDFSSNQLIVFRRADEKDDSRRDQPLVKTRDRRLPMKDTLAKELHCYIVEHRKLVPNAAKNDFLFVTHKSGPTQGQPLSKSGYKKLINVIRDASPLFSNLTGHQLRHSWNEAYSMQMDLMDEPPSVEEQEKLRSYLMGWKEDSGTSAIYNRRFVKRKAHEAAIELQRGMTRIPEGFDND